VTHCFHGRGAEDENLTDGQGKLHPEAIDARRKGIPCRRAPGESTPTPFEVQ